MRKFGKLVLVLLVTLAVCGCGEKNGEANSVTNVKVSNKNTNNETEKKKVDEKTEKNEEKNSPLIIKTEKEYSADGTLYESIEYDSEGRMIERCQVAGGDEYNDKWIYNKQGDLAKYMCLDRGRASTNEYQYEYDNQEKKIKMTKTDGTGNVLEQIDYIYNESGLCIAAISSKFGRTNYEYDERGNCIREYNGEDGFRENASYIEKKYDENDRCVSKTSYHDGLISNLEEYFENGEIKKFVIYNDGVIESVTYYDKYGTRTESLFNKYRDSDNNELEKDFSSHKCTYSYDDQENVLKIEVFLERDDSLFETIIFEYDNSGNCIKKSYYDKDGKLSGYKDYTYWK